MVLTLQHIHSKMKELSKNIYKQPKYARENIHSNSRDKESKKQTQSSLLNVEKPKQQREASSWMAQLRGLTGRKKEQPLM